MSDEIIWAARRQLRDALQQEITDDAMKPIMKKVRDVADDFMEHVRYDVQEYLAENLSDWVGQYANNVIQAFLAGNEAELRRHLKLDKGGWTGRDHTHSVIHGKLFEPEAMKIRRQIFEQFADLLKDERILDLESQLAAVIADNNKKTADISRLNEELYGYRRGA